MSSHDIEDVAHDDSNAHGPIKSATFGNRKSSLAMTLQDSRKIPIVELNLRNVTYRPVTSAIGKAAPPTAASNTSSQQQPQEGGRPRTTVLHNITTKVSPYQLTAWMGPSGSGKTSLTSVVAGLMKDPVNDLTPESVITINGEIGRLPKRLVGVVWQDDLLLSHLTVEETITFAAKLKTPSSSQEDKDFTQTLIQETMKELGLLHIRDNLIGSALANVPGISGGERKRTAVAAELVARPSLLLLDEPTSGLDATTARDLMKTLKELACTMGHAIAVVIHQPRTDIFKLLDHLLLLSKGHVLYDGPAQQARAYLESCPTVDSLPEETGIADWMMDTVMMDEQTRKHQMEEAATQSSSSLEVAPVSALAQRWRQHAAEHDGMIKSASMEHTPTSSHTSAGQCGKPLQTRLSTLEELKTSTVKYEASFWLQLQLLMTRTMKQRRGEKLTAVSLILTFTFIFLTCLFWWQIRDDTSATYERNSLLFFVLIAQGNAIVVGSLQVFQRERALLRRERAKKLYGVLPFFLAKIASDLTNNIILPVFYGIVVYFAAGLRLTAPHFFKFVLAYYLTLSAAQSMGFLLSILIPNMAIALIIAPTLTLFMFILGGFYIPLNSMHDGIQWASYLSFARYGYSALLINEFGDREIECATDVDVVISIGGSDLCPLPGELVYESLGYEGIFTDYWFNVGVLAVILITTLTSAYWMLRLSR